MIEKDDTVLVSKVLNGNLPAFNEIINKYQKIIFRYVYRTINDFETAKDITQVVFIKVYEKLYQYNPKYKFFSWVYRIAVNECINHLNSNRKAESFDDQILQNSDPARILEQKETIDRVNSAISMLKPEYKTLIILKHYEEYSYEEISEIMGIQVAKVKSRIYMARQILKNILLNKESISYE